MQKVAFPFLALMMALSLLVAPAPAFSQWGDDDYWDDDDYEDDDFGDGFELNLEENEQGLNDTIGLFRLDPNASTSFKTMSAIERRNALVKLQIEQEKLDLDLARQRAERRRIDREAAAAQRKIDQQEAEEEFAFAAAEAELIRQEEEAFAAIEKRRKEAALNETLMERLQGADLNNPDEVKQLTQLMALMPGANVSVLNQLNTAQAQANVQAQVNDTPPNQRFRLRSIMGAGNNMMANIENTSNASSRRIKKGDDIDGWIVETISSSAVVFRKDENVATLRLAN
ncbi:MAG: hypothetical protein FWD15_02985 [Alphaproteobacteria bacterium]|nr:hypothetical protein [Alphaproteobacteria bacterium]